MSSKNLPLFDEDNVTGDRLNLSSTLRLMAVTDGATRDPETLLGRVRAAVEGGVTSVQLRIKDAGPAELTDLARFLVHELRVPVIVNDRVDVALAAFAAGVHLGADDLPVPRVRAIAPAGFLIGGSVGDLAEAGRAERADYWGVGPWNATGSKVDAGPPIDRGLFARLVRLSGAPPAIAIGGVRPGDLGEIRGAGAIGVAVMSGIFGEPDCERAAREYRAAWDAASER
ncbi:MAG: thiamine phosphate synthase [Gemmatimonadales bacterium]